MKLFYSRPNITELFREKFPEYIVQCFVTSGFDDIDAIVEMDVDDGPGNSIKTIEGFINIHSFTNCMNPSLQRSDHPFEFPPGHKIRIKKLIKELKKQHNNTKRKLLIKPTASKQSKRPKIDEEQNEILFEDIPSVTMEIREKINKWVKNTYKKQVHENEHFTIIVKRDVHVFQKIVASVRCICGKEIALQRKLGVSRPWILSNWTKHYKKCTESTVTQSSGKQGSLKNYFNTSNIMFQNSNTDIPCLDLPCLDHDVVKSSFQISSQTQDDDDTGNNQSTSKFSKSKFSQPKASENNPEVMNSSQCLQLSSNSSSSSSKQDFQNSNTDIPCLDHDVVKSSFQISSQTQDDDDTGNNQSTSKFSKSKFSQPKASENNPEVMNSSQCLQLSSNSSSSSSKQDFH